APPGPSPAPLPDDAVQAQAELPRPPECSTAEPHQSRLPHHHTPSRRFPLRSCRPARYDLPRQLCLSPRDPFMRARTWWTVATPLAGALLAGAAYAAYALARGHLLSAEGASSLRRLEPVAVVALLGASVAWAVGWAGARRAREARGRVLRQVADHIRSL